MINSSTFAKRYKDTLSDFETWNQKGSVTMDLSDCMRAITREAFPESIAIRDCFHVVKRGGEACEEIRLRLKRDAVKKLNKEKVKFRKHLERLAAQRKAYRERMKNKHGNKWRKSKRGRKPQRLNTRFVPSRLENGETLVEALTRCNKQLTMSRDKWSKTQKTRTKILFALYPKRKEAYNLINSLRAIFRNKKLNKETAKIKFDEWYDKVSACTLREVKSVRGTQFRQWATKRIHEYIVKGFTMDDERLKGNGGGAYWKELLDRIRDIRTSEKVMYRQVLDLYATSADYNPKADESVMFFKMVQNKFHYAVHGHTAGELMVLRADAEKPFMGMQSFKGAQPTKAEAQVAKNYLDEAELKRLNNMVSAYFDIAELQAEQHRPMMMGDFVNALDGLIRLSGGEVLQGAGHVSMEQAKEKVLEEYRKYQVRVLSPVEEDYLRSLKQLEAETKEGSNR